MVYKVTDLENETSYLYSDRGFCVLIGISEANFANRWRLKTSTGIVVKNRWYIKQIELL